MLGHHATLQDTTSTTCTTLRAHANNPDVLTYILCCTVTGCIYCLKMPCLCSDVSMMLLRALGSSRKASDGVSFTLFGIGIYHSSHIEAIKKRTFNTD